MAGPSYTTNTGLSALPEIDQKKTPEIWAELVRIRQAINILQEALDAPGNVPAGGTIGQFLAKLSGTDYDIGWASNAHNDLASLQGGTPGEYYHLTSTEYADFLGVVASIDETIDDRVAALLVAGTNVTLVYDDVANTLTIDASGGGGSFALTQVTITVPSVTYGEYTSNVIDATVTATSKIMCSFHYSGDDAENGLDELDSMYVFAKANLGSIDFTLINEAGAFVGPFVINYAVSA